MKQSKKEPKKQ